MDLEFDDATVAFRDEVRAWLAANVPAEPLPSMDTAEGFGAHREWERTLADARWSVVSWPAEYGGRDAILVRVADLRGGVLPRRRPRRVTQNGIFLLAPTLFEYGTPEQQARILPRDGPRPRRSGPGLVRARGRQRPGRRCAPRRRARSTAAGC